MKKLSLQTWRARPRETIAVYPSVYTMAYATGQECLKEFGAKLNSIIYTIDQNEFRLFMESKNDYLKFSARLVNKFKKQPQYLDELIEYSENKLNLLFDYVSQKLNENIIGQLTNQELAAHYLEYTEKYLAYHFKNTPSWWIGALAAEEELKNYLSRNYSNQDIDNLLSIIIDPLEYPSENFKEELSLFNIAIKLNKNKPNKLRTIRDLPEAIRILLHRHYLTYTSLPFGYKTGLVWTEQDFFKRLGQLIKRDVVNLKLVKLRDLKIKKINRNKILADLNLPKDIKNLVFVLRKLAYLQDLKKTTQTKSHPILQFTVMKEIARRLKLDFKYLEYLSAEEIISLLEIGSVTSKFRHELAARDLFSVLIIKDMKTHWLVGKDARKFIKNNDLLINVNRVKEIKGQSASKGLVRGRVKICLVSTEINKIKKGDILVTAMTTPDFVPAMRKAAAIITDEGGITSHAAIVARELNKPCIIGVKIATKVLHDGDYIEVNAIKGIIKIIQRNLK